jgi:hypothetical protein
MKFLFGTSFEFYLSGLAVMLTKRNKEVLSNDML